MNDLMKKCTFPQLEKKYDTALKEAVRYIFQHFNPVGIIASGTIIRGNPDPFSDLDINVIQREPFRQRIQKFFNGTPTEFFINPVSMFDKYFKEEKRRPSMANMLATGFLVFQNDPVIDKLCEEAKQTLTKAPEASDIELTMSRYSSATLLEDAFDIAEKDPAASNMILDKAVLSMLEHHFLKKCLYQPRFKDIIKELIKLEPELGRLAEEFYLTGNLREKITIAEKIADRTIETRGFFEWDTEREVIKE